MASSLQAGASGPLSAFNRIRACSKVRAATLPRRVNGKSWACSSGVNRTTYFFMTEDLETEKAVGAAFFQAIPGYSTQQVIRDAPLAHEATVGRQICRPTGRYLALCSRSTQVGERI